MKKLTVFALMIFFCGTVAANNIQITNISVVPANNTIKFDVSWENSWRSNTLNNWDAAYVFFKYYDPLFNGGAWRSVSVTGSNILPSGFSDFRNTGKGTFIYRSVAGSGTSTVTNVEIGVSSSIASGIYDIKAFAIEMVYIPSANFFVGDGASANAYTQTQVVPGSFANTVFDPLAGATVNPGIYPGADAFYCMKYELSQGGYRDFLNSLTYGQQVPHIVADPNDAAGTAALYNTNRNNIKIKTPGTPATIPAVFGCDANNNGIYDEAADGEYIACNFLNWVDHAAYLDWAGLRPISEWEFEKAARGILLPVAGEFIWGNTNIHNISGAVAYYSFANLNQSSESINNLSASPIGNAYYFNSYSEQGPVRNGIFATATSNRISSGGSYYGVMELGGNLWERVITTANSQGRNFSIEVGDGDLTITASGSGFGYSPTWPGARTVAGLGSVIDGMINATGLIYRGGGWGSPLAQLRTSDRSGQLVVDPNTTRIHNVGVRGGCSAP